VRLEVEADVVGEERVHRLLLQRRPHSSGRARWLAVGHEPYGLGQGDVQRQLVDVALVEHRAQHRRPALLGAHRIDTGRVPARGGDDTGQHCGLGQGELAHRLAEVGLGCSPDSVRPLTQVDA
jgi:hypothetical protein